MKADWRTTLKTCLKEQYIRSDQEWFEMIISTHGQLNVTIVSDVFQELSIQERRDQLTELLKEQHITIPIGFLSLYTIEQAKNWGLCPDDNRAEEIHDWQTLAQWAARIDLLTDFPQRHPHQTRTIAFYSFKGGVGRTTALIHIAWSLAKRGRKVVAIDLDLEAPGLGTAIDLTSIPQYGIVDYFYERAYLPVGVEPRISIGDMLGEVNISNTKGRFFVIPAGKELNFDYIAKVDDLRANTITEQGKDLWSILAEDIYRHLKPDLIFGRFTYWH